MKHLSLYIFLICMTAGCATRPVAESNPEQSPSNETTRGTPTQQNTGVILLPAPAEVTPAPILACDSYSKSDTNGQKKQFIETQQVLSKNKQDLLHRIKLACMYALPSSYNKDTSKAQVLLQQLREEGSISDTEKAFINHVYLFNAENLRQQQKNRDDARALEALTQKYETLEKKYEASEQKLMHLKNIEKKLNVR